MEKTQWSSDRNDWDYLHKRIQDQEYQLPILCLLANGHTRMSGQLDTITIQDNEVVLGLERDGESEVTMLTATEKHPIRFEGGKDKQGKVVFLKNLNQ